MFFSTDGRFFFLSQVDMHHFVCFFTDGGGFGLLFILRLICNMAQGPFPQVAEKLLLDPEITDIMLDLGARFAEDDEISQAFVMCVYQLLQNMAANPHFPQAKITFILQVVSSFLFFLKKKFSNDVYIFLV
jgi:hypothetical protein